MTRMFADLSNLAPDLDAAFAAAGIDANVDVVTVVSAERNRWLAVVSLGDLAFSDEAAVRRVFERFPFKVESITHEIYSRFNSTEGGADQGGGKSWTVMFDVVNEWFKP